MLNGLDGPNPIHGGYWNFRSITKISLEIRIQR